MSNVLLKVKLKLNQDPTRSETSVLYEVLEESGKRIDELDKLLTECMGMLTPEQIESLGIFDES